MPKKRENPAEVFSIQSSFSNIGYEDWSVILKDNPEVFLTLASSIVKKKRRKGEKSVHNNRSLDVFNMPEFSEDDFHCSFNKLWGSHTLQQMVEKTGLTISVLQRLKSGERHPSFEEMRTIALSFEQHEAFFLEYRIGKILASVNSFLVKNPETATAWYKKVSKSDKLVIKR